MNNNLKELIENFNDYEQFAFWFKSYSNTLIDNCQRWELREALSFYFSSVPTSEQATNIVSAVQRSKQISWPSLTIVDEAIVQRLLRDKNYDLVTVNNLPTNTAELCKLIIHVGLAKQLKYNVIDRILRTKDSIDLSKIKRYSWLITYLCGAVYFASLTLLMYSLVIGFVVWIAIDFIRHDYYEHRYIVPRYRWLQIIIDSLVYFFVPSLYHDRATVISSHNDHHRYWKTDKDLFTDRIVGETIPGLCNYDLSLTKRPAELTKFKYFIEFKMIVLLILALEFGLASVVYFLLLPMVVVSVLQFQHDWYLMNFGERDYPWLFPLAFNQAWHLTHHKRFKRMPTSWNDIFNGPLWVKYINPQFYLARLLFKLNS